MQTMDMHCSHMLDETTHLTPSTFGSFRHLRQALNAPEPSRRLLEPPREFRRRSAREVRSHAANTGASTSRRDPILAERLDPNNRQATPPCEAGPEATQVARRSGEPHRPIQIQANRHVPVPDHFEKCSCTRGCLKGKCACLAAQLPCTGRCKHPAHGSPCQNRFGTATPRPMTAAPRSTPQLSAAAPASLETPSNDLQISNDQFAQLVQQQAAMSAQIAHLLSRQDSSAYGAREAVGHQNLSDGDETMDTDSELRQPARAHERMANPRCRPASGI